MVCVEEQTVLFEWRKVRRLEESPGPGLIYALLSGALLCRWTASPCGL